MLYTTTDQPTDQPANKTKQTHGLYPVFQNFDFIILTIFNVIHHLISHTIFNVILCYLICRPSFGSGTVLQILRKTEFVRWRITSGDSRHARGEGLWKPDTLIALGDRGWLNPEAERLFFYPHPIIQWQFKCVFFFFCIMLSRGNDMCARVNNKQEFISKKYSIEIITLSYF